jgi:hypothetical protein
MIGWFPTSYPDELFYSICARYQERAAYLSSRTTNEALFGTRDITQAIDLPSHLDQFISTLPPGHRITAHRVIGNHSLLPFYSPFHSADRVRRIKTEMRYGNSNNIHKLTGIINSTIRPLEWLRFCPTCVKEDRARFGCTYWHRVHQLPCIEVCSEHAIFLENSLARARNQPSRHAYIPAENIVNDSSAHPLDFSNASHVFQLNIARDAKWLLSQGDIPSDLARLRTRYLILLWGRKLASVTGIVWVEKLMSTLRDHFTPSLLKGFQCDFDLNKMSSWPSHFVKDMRKGEANHPLRHLLMMRLLGHSTESFFNLPGIFQPFGNGPWSCLNPACSHYGRRDLKEVQVMYRSSGLRGKVPIGIFRCVDCGFTYNRIGSGGKDEDSHRINRVLQYGPVWEKALSEHWEDPKLDQREIAERLATNRNRIKREAKRLDLQFPRQGPGYKATNEIKSPKLHSSKKKLNSKKPSNDDINKYRGEWLQAIKNNHQLGRTALKKKARRIYSQLQRHDSKWLSAHMPRSQKQGGPRRVVNWSARDAELARAVKAAANRLKKVPGKPIRITRSLIGKEIDRRSLLEKYLDKLPRTRRVLEKVVETRLQFAKRRIQWAAYSFHEESVRPSRSALLLRAALDFNIWQEPLVKAATEAALSSFMGKQ